MCCEVGSNYTYRKWPHELLACDEGMLTCLLWRPPLDGVEVQQALAEVNERSAIVQFFFTLSV